MKDLKDLVSEASVSELQIKGIDAKKLIGLLQDALAEEYNAWYAYIVVCPFLVGNERTETIELYKKNAEDELNDHAAWLIERISQLNGKPTEVLSPDMWNKTATHKYIMPNTKFDVMASLQENIKAEQGAIETYTKLEQLTRDKDIVTNNKAKAILADEQEHLQELQDLLADLKASK